jgi:hypothetical protein
MNSHLQDLSDVWATFVAFLFERVADGLHHDSAKNPLRNRMAVASPLKVVLPQPKNPYRVRTLNTTGLAMHPPNPMLLLKL